MLLDAIREGAVLRVRPKAMTVAVILAGLDRCLRRHGVGSLLALQAAAREAVGDADKPAKSFKDYEPGFVHIDIKYLPQMPGEATRRYSSWPLTVPRAGCSCACTPTQSEASNVDFLEHVHEAAPMKIAKVLTDNGSQFTDRFTSKAREPSGKHHFDVRCRAPGIERRLCPPHHPQTNGMVERFNGRLSEVCSRLGQVLCRVGIDAAGLLQDVQPPHPAARVAPPLTRPGASEMAGRATGVVQAGGIQTDGS